MMKSFPQIAKAYSITEPWSTLDDVMVTTHRLRHYIWLIHILVVVIVNHSFGKSTHEGSNRVKFYRTCVRNMRDI